jgi:serine protease Do
LKLKDLSADQKRELRQTGGVLVEGVDGPAGRAGIQAGDVILSLANVQVANVSEFEQVLAKADKAKPVTVLVRRGEFAQYVLIRPAAK